MKLGTVFPVGVARWSLGQGLPSPLTRRWSVEGPRLVLWRIQREARGQSEVQALAPVSSLLLPEWAGAPPGSPRNLQAACCRGPALGWQRPCGRGSSRQRPPPPPPRDTGRPRPSAGGPAASAEGGPPLHSALKCGRGDRSPGGAGPDLQSGCRVQQRPQWGWDLVLNGCPSWLGQAVALPARWFFQLRLAEHLHHRAVKDSV